MIYKAAHYLTLRLGPAVADGHDRHGEPVVRFETVPREAGEVFRITDPETARHKLAEGAIAEARWTGAALALAEATLTAENPLAAALAGFDACGWVWNAVPANGFLQPADAALGPTRSGFDAAFANAAAIERHWQSNPAAVPLFTIATKYGFDRTFRWKAGGLLEIPTAIHHL